MALLRRAGLLLAALALLGAGAAPVRAPGPLYAPVPGAWAGPLGAALSAPSLAATLTPGLAALSLETPAGLRAAAPLVAQLQGSLGYGPAAFAALSPADQRAAVSLAAESARAELANKAYELGARTRMMAGQAALDKPQRAELYGLVAELTEMRDHYPAFLEDRTLAEVEGAYSLAAGKAWEVRQALLGIVGGAAAEFAARDAGALSPLVPLRPPTRGAVKLRERMRTTLNGFSQWDFRTLYEGYGFREREGAAHRFYTHPAFPQLHESVGRHNSLATGYARDALKLLDEYDRLAARSRGELVLRNAPAAGLSAASDGPGGAALLAQLSVLLSPPSAAAGGGAASSFVSGAGPVAPNPSMPAAWRLGRAQSRASAPSRPAVDAIVGDLVRDILKPPSLAEDPVENPAPAAAETLTMPRGPPLTVRRFVTERELTMGNMFREKLPDDGTLYIGEGYEGELKIWQKNMLVRTDYVVFDKQGTVTGVIAGAEPSPPGTPWAQVPVLTVQGAHVLTVESGRAADAGLVPGAVVPELAGRDSWRESKDLAAEAAASEAGVERLLDYYQQKPDRHDHFADALVEYRRLAGQKALGRLYDKAFARGGVFRNSHLEGELSWTDPLLWATRVPASRLASRLVLSMLLAPSTFVHEFGHYAAVRLFGGRVTKFRVFLTTGGYILQSKDTNLKPWQQAVVSFAGPAAQALLGIVAVMPLAAALAGPHGLVVAGALAHVGWIKIALGYAGLTWLMGVIPGAAIDLVHATGSMGYNRMSYEMAWRRATRAFGSTSTILLDLLFGEQFGRQPSVRNRADIVLQAPNPGRY